MYEIAVDAQTYRSIELAARLTGLTKGGVIARLVDQASTTDETLVSADGAKPGADGAGGVPIFFDYAGHRTRARFDRVTSRIDIVDGPLAGQQYKAPSRASGAVISHYRPNVNPNRNGWYTWMLDDGSGQLLQAIRPKRLDGSRT